MRKEFPNSITVKELREFLNQLPSDFDDADIAINLPSKIPWEDEKTGETTYHKVWSFEPIWAVEKIIKQYPDLDPNFEKKIVYFDIE